MREVRQRGQRTCMHELRDMTLIWTRIRLWKTNAEKGDILDLRETKY